MPPQFLFRGDRLAFSNGILLLGAAASLLVVVFQADVTRLIPLYAFGVFVSFTLSQSGMVRRWHRLREPGWRRNLAINGVGAAATFVVAVIVGGTKFAGGAWISMLAMTFLGLLLFAIHRHYQNVSKRMAVEPDMILATATQQQQPVVVPIDTVSRATLSAIEYARSISENVVALHVTDDLQEAARLQTAWAAVVLDAPLVIVDSPYRSFVAPVVSYVEAVQERSPTGRVTVVLPVFRANHSWQQVLHNQIGKQLKSALREREGIITTEVVYSLDEEA
jgi:hypothetical protein